MHGQRLRRVGDARAADLPPQLLACARQGHKRSTTRGEKMLNCAKITGRQATASMALDVGTITRPGTTLLQLHPMPRLPAAVQVAATPQGLPRPASHRCSVPQTESYSSRRRTCRAGLQHRADTSCCLGNAASRASADMITPQNQRARRRARRPRFRRRPEGRRRQEVEGRLLGPLRSREGRKRQEVEGSKWRSMSAAMMESSKVTCRS